MTNAKQAAAGKLSEGLGVPASIEAELWRYFNRLCQEVTSHTLEKSTAGKFVETVVQLLEALSNTSSCYSKSVKDVDAQLQRYESVPLIGITNDSRIAICRIARAIYTLRNKRSIIHKNAIDPNLYDLRVIFYMAQWIMTELLRLATGISTDECARLIEQVQSPLILLLEYIDEKPIVLHAGLTVRQELLIQLLELRARNMAVTRKELCSLLSRRDPSSVSRELKRLWSERLVEKDEKNRYTLTASGIAAAQAVVEEAASAFVESSK